MDEILDICLPPWFAISINSALKNHSMKKILTFIEILWNFIQLKLDVVMCVSHMLRDYLWAYGGECCQGIPFPL